MKGQNVLFSRKSDEWETPPELFEALDAEFHFDLDPCATPENAKCARFFTMEEDGLAQNWGGYRVFCNPPYSNVGQWVKKAAEESMNGALVVLLIPARTDTKYFHEYIYHKAEIRFIRGRLRFSGSKGCAPFPSMVVIFEPKEKEGEEDEGTENK